MQKLETSFNAAGFFLLNFNWHLNSNFFFRCCWWRRRMAQLRHRCWRILKLSNANLRAISTKHKFQPSSTGGSSSWQLLWAARAQETHFRWVNQQHFHSIFVDGYSLANCQQLKATVKPITRSSKHTPIVINLFHVLSHSRIYCLH
jgi:hypothetical protein